MSPIPKFATLQLLFFWGVLCSARYHFIIWSGTKVCFAAPKGKLNELFNGIIRFSGPFLISEISDGKLWECIANSTNGGSGAQQSQSRSLCLGYMSQETLVLFELSSIEKNPIVYSLCAHIWIVFHASTSLLSCLECLSCPACKRCTQQTAGRIVLQM